MTNRERFQKIMNFEKCDRIPAIEWAPWWSETTDRWYQEGLSCPNDMLAIQRHFGLDYFYTIGVNTLSCRLLYKPDSNEGPVVNEADYERIQKDILTDEEIENTLNTLKAFKPLHDSGDYILRFCMDGFFWFPRMLFGVENHLYSFYDEPELLHHINSDLSDYMIKAIKAYCSVLKPDFFNFAEDMSYNLGPMLSKGLFDEFLKPYYQKVIPTLQEEGLKVFIDTDGQLEPMLPWLEEAGLDGVFPMERQAGVDINRIRENHPKMLLFGAYDKMVMSQGEAAMRAEFERILPVMRQGGYVPSCDHQTPPQVSLENYKIYVRLLKEYCEKAAQA